MKKQELIQVGIRANRKLNGDFEEAVPIYFAATKELIAREEAMVLSYEEMVAPLVKNYIDAMKKLRQGG